MKRSPSPPLPSGWPPLDQFHGESKELSLLSLVLLSPSEVLSNTFPVLNLQILLKVLKSSDPCAFTLATVSTFPFSDLLLRLEFDLHSPARLE
jgi:hypothetical protein